MPERGSRTETVRPGRPIRVGSVVLLPIERVVLRADRGARRLWVSAVKEPAAIVVRDGGGTWAVDAGATAVSLEELRERIPGLDALMTPA